MDINLAGSASSGAESGGPFSADTYFNFAPSTYGARYQENAPTVSPSASAALGGPSVAGGGTASANPNARAAGALDTVAGGGSNILIYVGLAAAAALGVWLITR